MKLNKCTNAIYKFGDLPSTYAFRKHTGSSEQILHKRASAFITLFVITFLLNSYFSVNKKEN